MEIPRNEVGHSLYPRRNFADVAFLCDIFILGSNYTHRLTVVSLIKLVKPPTPTFNGSIWE